MSAELRNRRGHGHEPGDAALAHRGRRREAREPGVRMVEVAAFPRHDGAVPIELAYTHDLSASGLCISTERNHAPGRLLRVRMRAEDGRNTGHRLARVVWSAVRSGGRFWLGLELLTERARREREDSEREALEHAECEGGRPH